MNSSADDCFYWHGRGMRCHFAGPGALLVEKKRKGTFLEKAAIRCMASEPADVRRKDMPDRDPDRGVRKRRHVRPIAAKVTSQRRRPGETLANRDDLAVRLI